MAKLSPAINGAGRRKCASWIEAFVAFTDNLESAPVFRKWAAITCLAAAMEQRVWLTTSDRLYPNLYTILVGHPGVGKTRTIMSGRKFLAELPEFHIAPTSMKMASLVDALLAAKRTVICLPEPAIEYNSMTLVVDEWTAFMHAFDDELVGGLTTFYDVVVPYEHHRRGKDIRIRIASPQLSILAGSTPGNLVKFMPDFAWDQGFASRLLLVYSNERIAGDDFLTRRREIPSEMIHDLKLIYSLQGEFTVEESYQKAVAQWRANDERPKPTHPKLLHYNTRRRAHLYKLSMVAAVDVGGSLRLTDREFNCALGWLEEAELNMPSIFSEGSTSVDARAMDEISDYVRRQRGPVSEHKIVHFASNIVAAHNIIRVLHIMQVSGRLAAVEVDRKTGQTLFTASTPSTDR